MLTVYIESRTADRISIATIELGHCWSSETKWKVVSLPGYDVEAIGALVLYNALAVEELDLVTVDLAAPRGSRR